MTVNKHRGEVTVRLLDGEKRLRLTNDALVRAEEALGGANIFAIMNHAEERFSLTVLRALVWAGMYGAGSKWKLADVGKQMNVSLTEHYMESVRQALKLAWGDDEEQTDQDEQGAEDGSLDPTNAPKPEST